MKYYLFLFLGFSITVNSFCQNGYMIDPNWKAITIEVGETVWKSNDDLEGSRFLKDEWSKGFIVLDDKKIVRDISISFDAFNNKIYCLLNNQTFVLDNSVPVIQFGINDQPDTNITTIFRSGYPAIDNNTDKTFYEVAAGNKISLLKHHIKSIIERKNSLDGPKKLYVDSESWYIYKSIEKKIFSFKKNKKSLSDILPQYESVIQSTIQTKNLKLKSDNDWFILFNEMNNQINQDKITILVIALSPLHVYQKT
jgi:hypothetical protein